MSNVCTMPTPRTTSRRQKCATLNARHHQSQILKCLRALHWWQRHTTVRTMPNVGKPEKATSVAPSKQKFVFVGASSKVVSTKEKEMSNAFMPPSVALNLYDKALLLRVSRDQLSVQSAGGGYKMVRATHGVHTGAYYWEAKMLEVVDEKNSVDGKDNNNGNDGSTGKVHMRLGWSTRQGELEAHVGFDKSGFGYRDIDGSKCSAGVRDDVYGSSFGPGDVIGCYISLDTDEPAENVMKFFKNGVDQGVAYRGLEIDEKGVFFPAVSLFGAGAKALVNFGPSFIYEHHLPVGANPISELQPMNPPARKMHNEHIASLRKELQEGAAAAASAPKQ